MPPCGFNRHAVSGALLFIGECYRDLLKNVQDGKHKSYEEAIEFELKQIEKALAQLHIDDAGNLVEREVEKLEQ